MVSWDGKITAYGYDTAGQLVQQTEYGQSNNEGRLKEETKVTDSAYQPFRLQNQYADRETGLHYNFFRYYEPDAGRLVSQDPIGLLGGANLYWFAPSVQAWVDPLGLKCSKSHWSGNRGRAKAEHDLKNNGFEIIAEEVTMVVNKKRIRADFVARDGHGNIHIFEVKHGNSRLTKNQATSGVFNPSSPLNTVHGIGGGVIRTSQGTAGSLRVATGSARGAPLGGKGATHNATFHLLKY